MELTRMTAAELSAALEAREVSATEVTRAHLDRIAAVDDRVHAFLHVAADRALEQAATIDEERRHGAVRSPLAGVPVAVKDVFATKGLPTTCGSRILQGWHPPYDATITQRLKQAGAVILGKTNMDEFAMGSSTENSAYGPSRNPWDLDKIPGGSSGGSSAAVAAYEAPLAIGTDTGGSIRQPAAVCGIVGTKPTYGGSSRYGVVAFASSLDTPGPFGRTVLDAALLHEAMSGHDPMDSTSIDAPVPPVVAAAREADVSGMRIGVVAELGGEGYQPGVLARFAESVELLESLGAKVTEVSCPHFRYALPAYYLIAPSECSSNLARFDAMRYGLRRGQAAHHPRRLRAVQRLLRRLLRQGAAGPHADHQGLRRGLRPGRRAGLAGHADHGVPHRRARRRPDGDVPGRPGHDPVRPGRQRRHLGPVRAGRRGRPAGRAAGDGARHGRRPALPGRRRGRSRVHATLGPSAARRGEGAVTP
jgi:aspartyl-tRNA(Asn)/glutamyl-tRNA(Gln) amidotransferase subunit A